MYRIVFDPKLSRFIVQLARFGGLVWTTCRDGEAFRTFITHSDAAQWVEDIGLHQVYRLQRPPKDLAAVTSPTNN